ncbi:hypothetical protein LCGC14_0461580 [marine sediment metagenome]|uniref:Radical SAM core domain-containing protein n=1 Tax=marine sediment metagenome TaxID=412755 RepID=A0A0F9SEX5_9ZZZZ
MKIIERVEVPTGDILVVQGDYGSLELLSLGDYGKGVNVKCDAMGLTRPLGTVQHTDLLPLYQKWVITISTQYGCSMGCNFCDVPKVGPGKNATLNDMIRQVQMGLALHPEVPWSDRLNIHFARMGEPTWNPHVLNAACWFYDHLWPAYRVHPVVSTMMPRHNVYLRDFLQRWLEVVKNDIYRGNAGLQLSINSTSETERVDMFNGNALSLADIGQMLEGLADPLGRKITLNFALAGYEIDPYVLRRYFDPAHYLIKLTPMHRTDAALGNGIETEGDYTTFEPYRWTEERLVEHGYDVLVFIASREEDEGRITCGNALLSGTRPFDLTEGGGA